MQLELWTDFCSCFFFVRWMVSDSVWQPSPLIILPKAARIHVQVLCQGALFQPLIWANWDADTYNAFSNLNEIPVVPHTHVNGYIHSHTFLLSSDSLHIFPFFLLSYPKVIMLSKNNTVFESFSLDMLQLLSCQFTLFSNFVHEVPSDLAIFLPTVFSDSYKVGIDMAICSILFYSPVLIPPCPVLKLWPVLKPSSNDACSPFLGTLTVWQNSVVREADLLISLAETWLLLVTSLCVPLKSSPLHAGITWISRWWLFCITINHYSFPIILCYHFPDNPCSSHSICCFSLNSFAFHNLFCGVACVMFNSRSSELAAFQW